MFKTPIAISLSPNSQADDVVLAGLSLFNVKNWIRGESLNKCEEWFRQKFRSTSVFSFNSGRSAFYFLLTSYGIKKGDEVIIQAFTCVAVPAAILWSGAKAVFSDIDESLNIDPSLLEKLITSKTKAIVVQHTFGIPAQMEKIKKIAQKYKLILIEDCSHSLGASFNGSLLGSIGDASFFSFGRDKVISCVFGGMAVINKQNSKFASKSAQNYNQIPFPKHFFVFQQLLHPIAFAVILPFYNLNLGKLLLYSLLKLNLLIKPVFQEELTGRKPDLFPQKLPNALAVLLANQLIKLDQYNRHRKDLAEFYFQHLANLTNYKLPVRIKGSMWLRFNIMSKNADRMRIFFRRSKILLGNWYHNIIDPEGVSFKALGYKPGSCPTAEKYAAWSVNLPTYPNLTKEDALRIINLFKEYDRQ